MKLGQTLVTMVVVSCVGVIVPRAAVADESNKQTVLTFSRDVEIAGKMLPAGRYVFRLLDSPTNRHVVQFDHTGRILATIFTIPASRVTAANDTRITFEEQPAGSPFQLKKWFYPGNLDGEEFIYPTRTN